MTESLFHGYINPYYWVDDHPLLYGNNASWSTLTHVLNESVAWDLPVAQKYEGILLVTATGNGVHPEL